MKTSAWPRRAVAHVALIAAFLAAWAPAADPLPALGQPAAQETHSVPQQSLYPGLEGAQLRAAIQQDYTPDQTLGYDLARDVLFEYLNDTRGELRGVYTGYAITLDPAEDPTQDAFEKGINTEHTWPQSKGAGDEPARSDMHALYPTKDNVNSSRSNHPFAEIPDADTDGWYRLDASQSTIPTSNIDEYSEKDNAHPGPGYDGRFEPREDHEGNAARAALYFYVTYETLAEAADPDFIDVQRKAFLAWHDADPVDGPEYDRSEFIATHQGTANPFILDTTLVRRALKDLPSESSSTAEAGAVVISEIMADPEDVPDEDGEWFEVYNPGTADANMEGWTIRDDDNDDALITEPVIVPAGGFAVLCKNDDESANGGIQCDYDFVSDSSPNDFFIANGDDELILSDGGTEIDRVEYDGGDQWPDPTGASMIYMDEPQADNNNPLAWGVATVREGRYDEPGSDLGSPGANGTNQVLPVELVRFTGRQGGDAVLLRWETASETENAGFEVERAIGGASYRPIAFVEGVGTTAQPQTYRHADEDIPFTAKRARYRLRQVDYDGTSTYSPEVEVELSAPHVRDLKGPFPNPASRQATIRYQIPNSTEVRLVAYDITGRRVVTLVQRRQEPGRKEITFNTSRLASGTYLLRLTADGAVRTQTITVVR